MRLTAFLILNLSFCWACGSRTEPAKPLVYEGMSSEELKRTLGNPDSINSQGKIFKPETRTSSPVEKWYYAKRTVVLINDTVTSPNSGAK